MLFKSGLGQKQGVGGWGRGGYVEWVGGGVCGVGGWGWGVGYPPLPTPEIYKGTNSGRVH